MNDLQNEIVGLAGSQPGFDWDSLESSRFEDDFLAHTPRPKAAVIGADFSRGRFSEPTEKAFEGIFQIRNFRLELHGPSTFFC